MDLEYTMFCWLLFTNGLFLGGRLARLASRQPVTALVLSIIVLGFSLISIPFTYNPGQTAHVDTQGRILDAVARMAAPAGGYGLAAAFSSVYRNSKRKVLPPKAKQGAA